MGPLELKKCKSSKYITIWKEGVWTYFGELNEGMLHGRPTMWSDRQDLCVPDFSITWAPNRPWFWPRERSTLFFLLKKNTLLLFRICRRERRSSVLTKAYHYVKGHVMVSHRNQQWQRKKYELKPTHNQRIIRVGASPHHQMAYILCPTSRPSYEWP